MINIELWRKRKKELHWSHDDLARESGVSRRTIAGIFAGDNRGQNPTIETVQAIERALGLDQPKPAWTEEDKALGVGDHPVHLSEEEWTWLELRSVLLDVMGKDYLNALIKMLEEIIRKKS